MIILCFVTMGSIIALLAAGLVFQALQYNKERKDFITAIMAKSVKGWAYGSVVIKGKKPFAEDIERLAAEPDGLAPQAPRQTEPEKSGEDIGTIREIMQQFGCTPEMARQILMGGRNADGQPISLNDIEQPS